MTRVLYICPVVPAVAGNGLAMRAGMFARGLARHHDLTLAVVRSFAERLTLDWLDPPPERILDLRYVTDRRGAMSWVHTERGRRVSHSPLPAMARPLPPSIGQHIMDTVEGQFDVVVVFHTYVAGVAIPLLDSGVRGILDPDDQDVRYSVSLAALDPSYAEEASRYEAFQREVFPWFERVTFSSTTDAVPPFVHIPNAVQIPPDYDLQPVRRPLTLLFVGNPSYLPNRDALSRLERHIVPAIERRGMDVELLHPGPNENVSRYYERAAIATVPLRAGGGTRIKILEAFAHHCPVVSTPTGAHGLAVRADEHLLITKDDHDDESFAQSVVDLAGDPDRRAALAQAARDFVVAHHDERKVGDLVGQLVEEVARAPL